jgi:hypothetical protein
MPILLPVPIPVPANPQQVQKQIEQVPEPRFVIRTAIMKK